ncbi:stAR-related lipid transfer protein 9-like [Xyrauchen texanus]|uniref:stAR-related lipid transfer protein 9-like n=1 Tax=Xyrauchen texanus TaxID=154827 RepID=UPI002242812D|nr:stAR-related lipid transfer protein 9-like [Xyrauchen texanus]
MPQKHQSTHMQKREPDKSIVKPLSPFKLYHKTPSSLNKNKHNNSECKSTDNVRGEHLTAVDDKKHVDGNVKDDRQRGKQKRCRRAHFTAPSSSSTDSKPDLSFDEITTSKVLVSSKASCTKPVSQASGRQSAVAYDRCRYPSVHEPSISAIISRSLEVHSGERHTQQPNTGLQLSEFGVTMGWEAENEAMACQGEHCSTEKIKKTETIATKADKDMRNDPSKPILGVYVEDLAQPILHTRDSAMHFASSDIKPLIHTRTAMEWNLADHKNQAFGSATNIADQHSPPDSSNKTISRCCSVDNGLNIKNFPLSSQLSTYANHKGLTSTPSSVEDSRDQISSEPLLREGFYLCSCSNKQTQSAFKCQSYNGASVELNQSLGQVDEIELVNPFEYESQEHGYPCQIKCDHGTQTIDADMDLKSKGHHIRSSTQMPMSKQKNGAPNTWASLQNISKNLFDLIHSTSDLLGNTQCMRTGEPPPKYEHPINCFRFSTVHSGSNHKKDCYTQTSMDIGIQTDNSLGAKIAMAHEVNVIVKVIGSDVSELDGDTKILREQAFERIKRKPDLRHKDSKAVDSQNSWITPRLDAFDVNTVDHSYKKSSSSFLGAKDSLHLKREEKQPHQSNVDLQNRCNKQVLLMDRASSPILTVKAARYSQQRQANTSQCLTNHETSEGQKCTFCKMQFKSHKMSNHQNKVQHQENLGILHTQSTKIYKGKSVSSMTLENQSDFKYPNLNGSDEYSINSMSSSTKFMQNKRKEHSSGVKDMVIINSTMNCSPLQRQSSTISAQTSPSFSDKVTQSQWECPDRCHLSTLSNQLSHSSTMLKKNHRSPELNLHNLNQSTQEDDAMSLVPSECNTDVLVNINPLTETGLLKEHQWIPDDLTMHNKFTNWSGISQQPPSTLSKINRPFVQYFFGLSPSYLQPVESQSHKPIYRPEPLEETNTRTREIERLRKERKQILSSLCLDLSPHQLTVELTEARLHYGQGETDALLKMLKSDSKEEPSAFTKQELLDRHRRSIESLRRERDARLQACHRARSLSPSKHRIPINHEKEQSQIIFDLPSSRRDYLQQLHQEVVETSSVPYPPRQEGQCSSDIELLLRDYSRARKEARAEIARARDRHRKRIEQEKRRIQQQVLSQAVKEDLQLHTRISNSTLCTDSNLTLSSGHTSGYSSSNSALLKDNTSPIIQANGASGFQVRTRPPVIPLQTLKPQRRWLSVQDVSLETSVTGYEPESSTTQSSPPCARQRTLSFCSPSSISASYQDIADCTLASAISEVYLASGGVMKNLLAGKSSAGWRHQGVERRIQVFHKASSRPTAHGFLGAMELERPLASLWCTVRDHSKTHLYHKSVRSAWTRPLDESTQLVYLLTETSDCQLKQPRDFCCLSTELKQDDMWVLAMQSVFEETLPRPTVNTVRGEMLPSAWILQPNQRNGREFVTVIYLLQVDLGTPSLAPRLLNTVSRKQAAVIADLDSFFSL